MKIFEGHACVLVLSNSYHSSTSLANINLSPPYVFPPSETYLRLQETDSEGDKGVLAVPVEYGDDGALAGEGARTGAPRIDWAAVEAANAGVHLPDETDEHYTRRILFSRVRYTHAHTHTHTDIYFLYR